MQALAPINGPRDESADPNHPTSTVDTLGQPPFAWIRQRRLDWENHRTARKARRAEAAHQRMANRMEMLGRNWRVLDLTLASNTDGSTFLAIGPGGLFAITVKDHGRSAIHFAGDMVQVDGRRPKHVDEARKYAQRVAAALSRRAGVSVPVMPVLVFAGTGAIAFHGMPRRCLVTSSQDLHRVLQSRGRRLAQSTIDKVYAIALQPGTWEPARAPSLAAAVH